MPGKGTRPRKSGPYVKTKAREIRLKLGQTIQEVAYHSGQSTNAVDAIERGDIRVKLETLMRHALALGCAVTDLYPSLGARPPKAKMSKKRTKPQGEPR